MADQTISLELQIDAINSAKTISDFKTAINDLKTSLAAAGGNFNDFANGATKVSDAEDKVKSLTTSLTGVTNAGIKIDSFTNIGGNIAIGFQSAKSAADLLGASGNELLKVLTKVKSVTQTSKQPASSFSLSKTDPEILAAKATFDNKFNLQTDFSKRSLAQLRQYQTDRKASGDISNNEELANDKKIADAKFSIAQDSLSTISSLVNTFAGKSVEGQKEAFEINKQISVARAIISTYQGANEALSTPLNAIAPGIGIASAAVIVAAGLANVAQIESQQFNGGSSGGGSSSTSGGAPSLQPLIQPTTTLSNKNQDSQAGKQQPLKVFVTESDIRNATNRIDTITSRAVIH